MALDNADKHVGTIFLGASNETTLEELDAMQATIRREDWNKNTQELYLFRIREKATEKAKQILGAAYKERQKIIDLAYADAQKIRDEANAYLEQSKQKHKQSSMLQDDSQRKFDSSEERGFESGLNQAVDEITDFRINMGSALINVIEAIEKQSELIFDQWRDDIVDLVHICVEKANDLTMSKEHAQILKNLVINSVKQLLDKRQINLYVHPDDEETVTQLFSFAKEAMPDIKHWEVHADPNLQLGDLIAECPINATYNKHEHRLTMVENILNNLSIPRDSADKPSLDNVHQEVEEQKQRINDLVPEIQTLAAEAEHETTDLENYTVNDDEQNAHSQNNENHSTESSENSAYDLKDDEAKNATPESPSNEVISSTPEAPSNEVISSIPETPSNEVISSTPETPSIEDISATTQNNDNIPVSEPHDDNEQKNDVVNNEDINTNLDSMDSMKPLDSVNDIPTNNDQHSNVDISSQGLNEPMPNNHPEHDNISDQDNNIANVQEENLSQTISDEESTLNTSQASLDAEIAQKEQAKITQKEQAKIAQKEQAEIAQKEEQDAAKKIIEELEQELLPLPENESADFDNSNNSDEHNSVLATGGFLETPQKDNE